jgi:hypothetical protein
LRAVDFKRQAYIVGAQHPVADLKEVVVFGFCRDNALFDLPAGGANEAFSSGCKSTPIVMRPPEAGDEI